MNLDGKKRMNKEADRKELYSIQRRIRSWINAAAYSDTNLCASAFLGLFSIIPMY